MRFEGLGFELGVKLAAKVPGVVFEFADFDVDAVGGLAGELQAILDEHALEFAIELIAMTMAFADHGPPVGLTREAPLGELARIRAVAMPITA